ncbi:MAG: threonine ammonia-lyase, partial [Candidatus Dadabacteria bacterium]|nr:threonine ammonia-lyase [Candidatus Dadabacteria bacterium]NIQ14247.1 threonine ammonia-lyase [Candidatus Dadabacteria bacterium]
AASAGNHAQGVALASRLLKMKATLVMPEGTPINKILSVKRYGANVVLHGDNFDDAFKYASVIEKKSKMNLIHAFNDESIIAGQGTIGLEIIDALSDVDVVLVPVGGGGLVSGIAVAIKAIKPDTKIIGVEAKSVPSMSTSLKENKITESKSSKTIADGIAIKKVGDITFRIAQKLLDDMILVTEREIEEALMILASKKRLIVEGSGAVGLAGLLKRKKSFRGKNTVIIVSGGNIDINVLGRIIDRGLKKDGRIMNLQIELPDIPGALGELSTLLGELKANIIEIFHDRLEMDLPLDIAYVKIKLETRSFEHQEEIKKNLKKKNYKIV